MPFEKGNTHGTGRPVGSRNKITKAYLDAIAKDFQEHGVDVIEKLRKEQPAVYFTTIARLIPQKLEHTGEDGAPLKLGDTERAAKSAQLFNLARERRTRQVANGGSAVVDTADRPADGGEE